MEMYTSNLLCERFPRGEIGHRSGWGKLRFAICSGVSIGRPEELREAFTGFGGRYRTPLPYQLASVVCQYLIIQLVIACQ
jgi:hypothetical protein